MLVLLAFSTQGAAIADRAGKMKGALRAFASAVFAAFLWSAPPVATAQPPPGPDDVRVAPEDDNDTEGVGAKGVVVGLLGAGVALALVVTAHSLWVVKRRKGEPLADADDSVQRLGR